MKPFEPSENHRDIAAIAFRHGFSRLIFAFMVLWIIAGVTVLFHLVTSMITEEAPLVINGEQTSWPVSIGFIILVLIAIAFGLACQISGLRYCRSVEASAEGDK